MSPTPDNNIALHAFELFRKLCFEDREEEVISDNEIYQEDIKHHTKVTCEQACVSDNNDERSVDAEEWELGRDQYLGQIKINYKKEIH